MPPNRVANIRRKWRQIDANLRSAEVFAASIYKTVKAQHPELGERLLIVVQQLDLLRERNLALYREYWSGTERGLWKPGDLKDILATAPEVPKGSYER